MSSRGMYLIGMLVLLFLANVAMLMGMTNWPMRTREGFASAIVNGSVKMSGSVPGPVVVGAGSGTKAGPFEPFMDYLSNGFATEAIGSYDGMNMAANLPASAQGFRATAPNVPLKGPAVQVGPDNLNYFLNNETKPECCSSTLSSNGGCVCTTPEQRSFISSRGGNTQAMF